MSEDATEPTAKRRWRRIAMLGGTGAIVVAAAIVVAVRAPHRTPAAVAVVRHDGGAMFHAPEAPSMPSSGMRLTGFVIDGAGLPVAAAEVSAELERGTMVSNTLDAGVGLAVAAPTGVDGRFVLDVTAAGRYRLRVTGVGLLAAELRFVWVPSDEARIVVARQVAIEGTVTDGGKPVGNAHVGIRGDPIGGTLETKTDAHGAFSVHNLPEGRYQVYAWQGALAARTIRVGRLGAGPFGPVELRLEAGAIVVGRVIDRDEGTGLVAAIELRPSGDDQAPRYARSEDGVFRIEGVPNGRWIADAFAPGYLSPGGVELDAGKGIPELALVRGAAIEGRVLDGDGHPVAGAAVRAVTAGPSATEVSAEIDLDRLRRFSGRTAAPVPEAGMPIDDPTFVARGELGVTVGPIPPLPPPGAQVARAAAVIDPLATQGLAGLADPTPLPVDPARASIWVTGSDGRYRVRGLAKAKVTIIASAAGFAEARSREVAIAPGEVVTKVDVIVTVGTFVIGKVTDQHGAPVVGAELSAQPEVGAPSLGFSDGDGEYRLGPVTGKVELHATAYGHVEIRRTLELAPVKATVAAERREDLVLEVADAILAGTLDDATGAPIPNAHLEIVGGSGEGRQATVAADGTFSIDMLPRGHLRVRVEHPDYPADELDAVASATGERVRLHLALGGAIEGVVLDGVTGGPLSGIALTASGPSGSTAEAATDKLGRWKLGPLRPGHWRVEVKPPGYLPQVRELDVPAARTPGATSVRDVRIDLALGALVGGTVRDGRGQRVAGAHVIVRLADGSGAAVEGDTDIQGEFRLRDCPTGEVSIGATFGDAGGSAHATVRPGDEVLGLSIDIK